MKYYKGKFKPKNPRKYAGDPNNIIYRSTWELRFFKYLDETDSILEWASEELVIPYFDPVTGKMRRYFPDIVMKALQKDGSTKTFVVEIKPMAQTKEPEVQKRKTKKYIVEVMTWGTNQAKWKAAEEFCSDRKWEFKILNENDLGIK